MSLTLATLIPGLLLLALGLLFLVNNSATIAMVKAMPRSQPAAVAFFGVGAAWFLHHVWHLSEADFGEFRVALTAGFAAVAVLSFFFVPDFLAVRGLAVLVLLGAWPLLMAGFMNFEHPQIYFQKVILYLLIILALYLGASPFRLRDFFDWLYRAPGRARVLGSALTAYGLLLAVVAFTY